jgi:ATP-dependent helicase Lhr and Lhr-like helicase
LMGIDGLREVVAALDGYELAAGAWERHVLSARLDRYDPAMLDMLCLSGEAGWARLSATTARADGNRVEKRRTEDTKTNKNFFASSHLRVSSSAVGTSQPYAALVSATPIALFMRERAAAWRTLRPTGAEPPLTEAARNVLSTLRARGASFFADLASACGLDSDALRQAIGTLVSSGLATSDGFSGVRALVWAARGRPGRPDPRSSFAGRWTAIEPATIPRDEAIELQAWTLLRRYGVVFRRLLTRETNAAPWRELVRVYRRLEARGEIRGGRFVTGMSGEQFALPDAIERLREVRRSGPDRALVTISAADPLNLTGIVTPGERLRTASRNRVVYRDGVPLAVREGDFLRELAPIDASTAADVSRALRARRAAATVHYSTLHT